MAKVVCKTKHIGGGFGGKKTRSAMIAAAAAVPSYLLNRPVKLTLDRDVDMMSSGQRHSFLGKYKVGFTNEGKLLAWDLSLAVLERAMFHSDNVYEIPNIRIAGRVCFTNIPSNTAFRGFGGPQGLLIAENWIQRIAVELKRSPEEIRARSKVDRFNSQNCWKKRGVAMVPTKFGISFTLKFMNQVCCGCCVEGEWLRNAFRWKETVGPWEERPGHFGDVWMYWTDDGLGYFEFLQVGISHGEEVATSSILPFVQEMLDSVEFARGAPNSTWGAVRAAMGHPEPFDLRYVAIGNEDCEKTNYRGNISGEAAVCAADQFFIRQCTPGFCTQLCSDKYLKAADVRASCDDQFHCTCTHCGTPP
ncbi:hypothetical protein IFM89_006980 [Coptis chinensis]|uniref:Aldehyde oxidase/xanthine dehydrogenase first molybdopterin binding domain-containing protein n=1 Tax=Coptis chinensis TaxID=261450 RepID=A0A835HFS6_9MAGN|nr:hypothetical protein IFM89_006980 [Coptis chinensis]